MTWTPSTGQYTASADNSTDKKVRCLVQVHPYAIYSASLDATVGTTTGSDLAGHYTDLADLDDLDESSVIATSGQFWVLGLDPNNSARVLCMIAESQGKGEDVDA